MKKKSTEPTESDMAVLSMEALPLGFRFRPTDEELITHYLKLKVNGRHSEVQVIPEIDVCKWEPWDLPNQSVIKSDDQEWFFFCPRDRKYPNGHRSNRATDAGYWKATGKDRTIKSRQSKSASNSNGMVGMKKTLVFYRGRAPKGERTSWIMHEYRPTQKELDGTAPGQSPFVLCRLFHKPEEKADVLKYDEVEQTGLSPTTTKSSPDETSSDIVQETATSDMNGEKTTDGIMRWLTETDNLTPETLPPLPADSYMASDVEDHGAEETGIQGHLPMEENLAFYENLGGEIDCKVFSPLHSQINTDLDQYMGSPFTSDFGNCNNRLHFQDGTCEGGVSLTELLDEFGCNPYESSCEESPNLKNLVVGNEAYLSGQTSMLQNTLPGNSCLNDAWGNTDTKVSQHDLERIGSGLYNEQFNVEDLLPKTSFDYYQAQAQQSFDDRNPRMEIMGDNYFSHSSFGEQYPVGSGNDSFNNINESTSWKNLDNHGGDHSNGTGIKIRVRHPQQRPNSDNFVNQGTASRRLRLSTPLSGSVANGNMSDANYRKENEVQSTISETREDIQQSPTSDEQEEKRAIFKVEGELYSGKDSANHGRDPVRRRRVKVKRHQRQRRSTSDNSVTQGTTPKRVHLQMDNSLGSVADSNVTGADDRGEDEVESTITEAREDIQKNVSSDDQEQEQSKINSIEELTSGTNSVNYGFDIAGRTGIRIDAHKPQQPSMLDDSVTKGTAPRRIRLQTNISPGSVANINERDRTPGEEHEVQSNINEARETSEGIPNFDEQDEEQHLSKSNVNQKVAVDLATEEVDESRETAEEPPTNLKLRTGMDNSSHSSHMGLSVSSKAAPKLHGLSSTFVIPVVISLALTFFIAYNGIWIAGY